MGLILNLMKRFDIISKVLPTLFKNAAEGGMGPQVRAVYWWPAGKKTVTGAILMAVGPDPSWDPPIAAGHHSLL